MPNTTTDTTPTLIADLKTMVHAQLARVDFQQGQLTGMSAHLIRQNGWIDDDTAKLDKLEDRFAALHAGASA